MTRLIRTVFFESLHRYENKDWDTHRNATEFGRCFTPHGHGHSYKMECWVEGAIQPETGMVINLKDLDTVIKSVVADVDKKHLNFEVPEFLNRIPTTERLAGYMFDKIAVELKPYPVRLIKIRLFESDDIWVDESRPL